MPSKTDASAPEKKASLVESIKLLVGGVPARKPVRD